MQVQEIKDKLSLLNQCIQSIEGEINMIQSPQCTPQLMELFASYAVLANCSDPYLNSLSFPSKPILKSFKDNVISSSSIVSATTERHVVYGTNLSQLIEQDMKDDTNLYFSTEPTSQSASIDNAEGNQLVRRRARSTSTASSKSNKQWSDNDVDVNVDGSEFSATTSIAGVKYTYGKSKKVNKSEDSADEDWTPDNYTPKRSKRLQHK